MEKITIEKRDNMLNRFSNRKTFMTNIKSNRYAWIKTYYHMSLIGTDNFGAKIIDIWLKHAM